MEIDMNILVTLNISFTTFLVLEMLTYQRAKTATSVQYGYRKTC